MLDFLDGPLTDWLGEHKQFLSWLGAVSVVSFVASLILVPILIARIPRDYFLGKETPFESRHPALTVTLVVLKNLLGLVLLIGGVVMLVIPGQGLLTMLIGLSLLNFPGKQELELWVIRRPTVNKAVNWIRRKAGRAPLRLPKQNVGSKADAEPKADAAPKTNAVRKSASRRKNRKRRKNTRRKKGTS